MALARVKSWTTNEVLTASDLNAEFNNILNNPSSLITPLTADWDFGGFRGIGLSAGSLANPSIQPTGDTNTGIYFSAGDTIDFSNGAVRSLSIAGVASGVNYLTVTPAIATAAPILAVAGSDTNIGLTLNTKASGNIVMQTGGTARATLSSTTLTMGTSVGITVPALTADSFLYSGTGGALTTTTAPTNGQLLIGSTGAAPAVAALASADASVTITNGAGTIDLSASGGHTVVMLDGGTEKVNISSAQGTFTNVDISGQTGANTALFAIIAVALEGTPDTGDVVVQANFRKDGSSATTNLPRVRCSDGADACSVTAMMIVECVNEIFEYTFSISGTGAASGTMKVDLIGYIH